MNNLSYKQWRDNLRKTLIYKVEKAKLDFVISLNRNLKKHAITHAEFAERIEASGPYISKVMRGDTNLTIETMVKLCEAIDCELSLSVQEKARAQIWLNAIPKGNIAASYGTTSNAVAANNDVWANQQFKQFARDYG